MIDFQPSSPIRQRAPSTTSEPDNIVANIEEKKKKYSTEEVNTILVRIYFLLLSFIYHLNLNSNFYSYF